MGVIITFDTLAVGGSQAITAPAIVFGTDYNDTRYNQITLRTADGDLVTYDNGVNIVNGVLSLRGVTYADGQLLKTWINDKAVFALNSFTISSDSSSLDMGLGKGTPVTGCTLLTKSDKSIFRYVSPGIYTIKFPYSFNRP